MAARILIVEDEAPLTELLRYNLAAEGYEVETAMRGDEAEIRLKETPPDLVVLDWMLPGMSGIELCRRLRARTETERLPIIMLTARGEESERVRGLATGADDYIVKPFSVRELMLRIQAILRRAKSERPPSDATIEFGCLKIDREAHRVWVEEHEIELTALEFRLLVTLYERKNRVQTRAALLDDVWGIQADITTRTVDTHVKRLREKLEGARDYVETVRGVGYRFKGSPDEASI